jgi:hypothetical protein
MGAANGIGRADCAAAPSVSDNDGIKKKKSLSLGVDVQYKYGLWWAQWYQGCRSLKE